jgi:hypothetical protein
MGQNLRYERCREKLGDHEIISCAGHDIATNARTAGRHVNGLIVLAPRLTRLRHHQQIEIAVRPVVTARAAAEEPDRLRVERLHQPRHDAGQRRVLIGEDADVGAGPGRGFFRFGCEMVQSRRSL